MSDRERWIVYPLLFLALGAALRDKMAKQTRAKQIVCEQMILVDSEGLPTALLLGDPSTPLSTQEVALSRERSARLVVGYVNAGVVDAETLAQRGKPVSGPSQTPGRIKLPMNELLKLLPRLGITPQIAPAAPDQTAPQSPPPTPDPVEPTEGA